MTNFMNFAKEIHELAIEKGWWEDEEERRFPEIAALIHSEISEALEEYRNSSPNLYFHDDKPEGLGIELADAIIRILDYCARTQIDIDKCLEIKHNYNKTRPYRHGGKKV
jgi:NTP pyrophosphatase (non-canonical NTP hydrolase)